MTRKITACLLAVLVLLTMTSGTMAKESPNVSVQSVSAGPGDTVAVAVKLSDKHQCTRGTNKIK